MKYQLACSCLNSVQDHHSWIAYIPNLYWILGNLKKNQISVICCRVLSGLKAAHHLCDGVVMLTSEIYKTCTLCSPYSRLSNNTITSIDEEIDLLSIQLISIRYQKIFFMYTCNWFDGLRTLVSRKFALSQELARIRWVNCHSHCMTYITIIEIEVYLM